MDMGAEIIKLGNDIRAPTVNAIKDKSKMLEIITKAAFSLSTVMRRWYGFDTEMYNFSLSASVIQLFAVCTYT
jgi:hypothetical protein